jgi:hypothetical protein
MANAALIVGLTAAGILVLAVAFVIARHRDDL